jgi:hypothetical protein
MPKRAANLTIRSKAPANCSVIFLMCLLTSGRHSWRHAGGNVSNHSTRLGQEVAALRNFNPADVQVGSPAEKRKPDH